MSDASTPPSLPPAPIDCAASQPRYVPPYPIPYGQQPVSLASVKHGDTVDSPFEVELWASLLPIG
jgi:hypothetical protein